MNILKPKLIKSRGKFLILLFVLLFVLSFSGCLSHSSAAKTESNVQNLPMVNTPNIDAPCLLPEPAEEKLTIHFLDAGKAFSLLIETPGSKTVPVDAEGLKSKASAANVDIDLDPGVKCEMLTPNGTDYEDLSSYSGLIRLTFGDTAFLFSGDAEGVSEQGMIAKGGSLKADVLIVGYNGRNSSTVLELLRAVSPKYIIISAGKGIDYEQPVKETLSRLVQANVQVFRTDLDNTNVISTDGKTITIDK